MFRPVKNVTWRSCLRETETLFKSVLGRIYVQVAAIFTALGIIIRPLNISSQRNVLWTEVYILANHLY
jgi:hypothetical protein